MNRGRLRASLLRALAQLMRRMADFLTARARSVATDAGSDGSSDALADWMARVRKSAPWLLQPPPVPATNRSRIWAGGRQISEEGDALSLHPRPTDGLAVGPVFLPEKVEAEPSLELIYAPDEPGATGELVIGESERPQVLNRMAKPLRLFAARRMQKRPLKATRAGPKERSDRALQPSAAPSSGSGGESSPRDQQSPGAADVTVIPGEARPPVLWLDEEPVQAPAQPSVALDPDATANDFVTPAVPISDLAPFKYPGPRRSDETAEEASLTFAAIDLPFSYRDDPTTSSRPDGASIEHFGDEDHRWPDLPEDPEEELDPAAALRDIAHMDRLEREQTEF